MTALSYSAELSEKTFQHNWKITNWKEILESGAVADHKTTETILQTADEAYATILFGTSCTQLNSVCLHWKLQTKHCGVDQEQIELVVEILKRDGTIGKSYEIQEHVVVGTKMQLICQWWFCDDDSNEGQDDWTDEEGCLKMRLKFSFINLRDAIEVQGEFKKTSSNELFQNIARLLDDKASADVKFVTEDKTEVFGHKIILHAQCPVFTSTYGTAFLESSTTVVNVDDISAKTLKILLNYWYTGELLPSWNDDDTVVEFMYAAGKYEMIHVLKMLDNKIGLEVKSFSLEVDLLNRANQFNLKNAEARLLKRVIHKIGNVTSGKEFVELFSFTIVELTEESFKVSQIFEAWNNGICESKNTKATFQEVRMMLFAFQLGLKHIENKLLKRISTVKKLESVDELIKFFEDKNEAIDNEKPSNE